LSVFLSATALAIFLCDRRDRFTALLLTGVVLAGSSALPGVGQAAGIAIGTLIGGIWAVLRKMPPWAPIMAFSASILLKPQLGCGVLLFLWLHRDFRKAIGRTALICLAFAGVSILLMQSRPASSTWLADWMSNMRGAVAPKGISSPIPANPEATRMTHFETLFSVISQNPGFYVPASLIATLFLAGAFARACLPVWHLPETYWLSLGAASCLSLLAVYHRLYDARLLLVSLPALMILLERRPAAGLAAIACSIPVLFSFAFKTLSALGMQETLADLPGGAVMLVGRQAPIALAFLTVLYVSGLKQLAEGPLASKRSPSRE
jgi:hypothetical protein